MGGVHVMAHVFLLDLVYEAKTPPAIGGMVYLVWCVALLNCVVNHCWLCCQLLACVVKPFIACVFDHSNALIAMPINPSSCWSAKQSFVVVDRSLMRTFETTVATIACVVDDGVRKPRQR